MNATCTKQHEQKRGETMCSEDMNLAFPEIKEGRTWWMGMRLQSNRIMRLGRSFKILRGSFCLEKIA